MAASHQVGRAGQVGNHRIEVGQLLHAARVVPDIAAQTLGLLAQLGKADLAGRDVDAKKAVFLAHGCEHFVERGIALRDALLGGLHFADQVFDRGSVEKIKGS